MQFGPDHIKVQRKENGQPLLLNGDQGKTLFKGWMECLTPTASFDIFMDNYFSSFRLLTHIGVNNIRATGFFNKNRLRRCTIIGDKQLQKEERGHLVQRSGYKANSSVTCVVGQNDTRTVYKASSESCQPKRFIWCWYKVERKFKNNNQINSTVTTRTWILSTEWNRTQTSTGLVSE